MPVGEPLATRTPRTASLLPVFLIVLVDVFGMTLVIPLLAIYAEGFGATPLQATLLVSVFAVCMLLSGPLIGHASDRHGRKPLLLVSQIGTFIGFIVLARATSLWMIYLSRIIDGVTAGNLSSRRPTSQTTRRPRARESIRPHRDCVRPRLFHRTGAHRVPRRHYGNTAPIYLAAAMSATSIFATATLLEGGGPPRAQAVPWAPFDWRMYARYFARPALRPLLLQFLFFMLSFSTFISGFALFAERRFEWNGQPFGPREIGYVFGFVGFLGIILQGLLSARWSSASARSRSRPPALPRSCSAT